MRPQEFISRVFAGWAFLAAMVVKELSKLNEPHPIPRGTASKLANGRRSKPYVSIFSIR